MTKEPQSLLTELRLESKKTCSFAEAFRSMPPPLQADVKAALADPMLHNTAIARALTRRGYRVNRQRIAECRKNCDCGELNGVEA